MAEGEKAQQVESSDRTTKPHATATTPPTQTHPFSSSTSDFATSDSEKAFGSQHDGDDAGSAVSQRREERQEDQDVHENSVEEENGQPEDVPPDGGYGWVCTACVFLINAHTWGVNSSYGIFLSHYLQNDIYPGATPLDYAFVGGLSISCALVISPVATYTTRRWGTRFTLFVGVFLETLSLLGASFSTEIWQLFLSQGLCFGWGMGMLFVGSVGIIPQWFSTKRSFANGISTAGSGLGGLTYSLATQAMIRSVGLGWAFRVLGLVSFAVNSVCSALIRDRNAAVGARQVPFDTKLFRRWEYNAMLAWGFFSMLGYITLLFSLPNYAVSIGLTPQQGSVVGALLNLGQALGRPVVGIVSDRAGRINIATGLTFLCGLFCLVIWIFSTSYGVLIFFAILSGTVAGTIWATIAPVGAEVVGLKDLPSALSIAWVVFAFPSTFAEVIGLELRRDTGNIYLHAQLYTGFMYVAAALCLIAVRVWKIGQLEALVAEIGRPPGSRVEASEAQTLERVVSKESKKMRSPLWKRLGMWKKV